MRVKTLSVVCICIHAFVCMCMYCVLLVHTCAHDCGSHRLPLSAFFNCFSPGAHKQTRLASQWGTLDLLPSAGITGHMLCCALLCWFYGSKHRSPCFVASIFLTGPLPQPQWLFLVRLFILSSVIGALKVPMTECPTFSSCKVVQFLSLLEAKGHLSAGNS